VSPPKDLLVRFPSKETAELAEEERSREPLAPDELAGGTVVSLVSAGTELAGWRGLLKQQVFPWSPGYAAIFRAEECGTGVKDIAPGALVFSMGHHRSRQRARRENVLPVPAGLIPESAVFARMMNVTMSTLVTTTARPPSLVVVSGLGLVGHLAAQVFASCGYRVIGVDPVRDRREALAARGVRDVRERIPLGDAAVEGKVSLVVECSGHEQAALDACRVVRQRGEVVLTGVPWLRKTDLFAHELLSEVFFRYVVLRSGWEWEIPGRDTPFREGSIWGNLAAALEWLAAGKVRVDGLHEKRSPREAAEVYRELAAGRSAKLSVLFDWRMV
jgi:threonine dehydrogenase-like Zn-dependent dehydrogenase